MHVILPLHQLQPLDCLLIEQRGIAQVVCHHNRGVQRSKVESRYRDIVEALGGLNDSSTFVLLVRPLALKCGN